ncbi:MAG TPA: hypothetical protein VFS12_06770, partial [Terriglobia bacterium]|nr:hypothetical protein [Terriglobia bacterium]
QRAKGERVKNKNDGVLKLVTPSKAGIQHRRQQTCGGVPSVWTGRWACVDSSMFHPMPWAD